MIPVTSVFCSSAGGWNRSIQRLIRSLLGALEGGRDGALQLEDIGRLAGLITGGPGANCSALGDDGTGFANLGAGNI